jgi:hypothetical protein
MITSLDIQPLDVQNSLLCSLQTHIGNSNLDAIDAIMALLYTKGKLKTNDNDNYLHPEMILELQLNLQAFYHRCAHFAFAVPSIEAWSALALEEY